jgi:SAM-dependent methyltransferase
MHPRVYQAFETICRQRGAGGAVLEVGAVASGKTLLAMKCLANASEKIGINLKGQSSYADFKIVEGNANAMSMFPDGRFDTVLSNATLEHDKHFWKTISEIHRVTKRGGLIVIGVPGYTELFDRVLRRLRGRRKRRGWLFDSTITFRVHNAPGDFYRFSEQAVAEVFLDGSREVQVESVMVPPRIIGSGIKS